VDNVPVNAPSFTINSQCAWGACIETTLLTDLSEEERSSLAEHILTCSACARRFRQYQLVEEFAEELPQFTLLKASRRPRWMPEKRKGAHFVKELTRKFPWLILLEQQGHPSKPE